MYFHAIFVYQSIKAINGILPLCSPTNPNPHPHRPHLWSHLCRIYRHAHIRMMNVCVCVCNMSADVSLFFPLFPLFTVLRKGGHACAGRKTHPVKFIVFDSNQRFTHCFITKPHTLRIAAHWRTYHWAAWNLICLWQHIGSVPLQDALEWCLH